MNTNCCFLSTGKSCRENATMPEYLGFRPYASASCNAQIRAVGYSVNQELFLQLYKLLVHLARLILYRDYDRITSTIWAIHSVLHLSQITSGTVPWGKWWHQCKINRPIGKCLSFQLGELCSNRSEDTQSLCWAFKGRSKRDRDIMTNITPILSLLSSIFIPECSPKDDPRRVFYPGRDLALYIK